MGTAASKTAPSGALVISPRVQMNGKKGAKVVVLDSAPLSDVGTGTIRYRYQLPEMNDVPEKDIQTGYFYHPKLKDYSELGDPGNEDALKFIKVEKGPSRCERNIFYVSGIGFHGNKQDMPPSLLANGKVDNDLGGKVYGHRYFKVIQVKDENDDENFANGVSTAGKELRLKVNKKAKVLDVKRKVGHHLLCPLGIVHLSGEEGELNDDHVMSRVTKGDKEANNDVIILKLIMI